MRRRKAVEREILADPKFNSKIIAKFINMVTVKGKKSLAEKIVYGALPKANLLATLVSSCPARIYIR